MDAIQPTESFIEGQQPRSLTRSFSVDGRIEGKYKLLLVDDNPSILDAIGGALSDQGYCVKTSSSAEAAVEAMNTGDYDLVITDLNLGQANGIAILRKAKEPNSKTMVIILTGNADVTFAIDALRLGADDYMLKPCDLDVLLRRVAKCLERLELKRRDEKSKASVTSPNELILNMMMAMSHDIRGSLVSMAAGLKMVTKGAYGKMDEGVASKLNTLFSKVMKSIGTTEDFVGKTFSVNGDLEIDRELVDLRRDIVDPVLNELSGEIQDLHIIMDNRLDANPANWIPIKASRIWLKVVFRNLLKNAVKYGGNGGTIAVGLKKRGSYYRLNIYNSGRPVPEECRNKLFRKFGRIAMGGNGSSDGLGLGLYLTREIIRKHGGDIWYEAKEHGSNFVFTLPRE
jgi:K+-sensing histidine kinase KdpD